MYPNYLCLQIHYCLFLREIQKKLWLCILHLHFHLHLPIPISFFYFQDPCAAVQWSTNTKIATSVSAMSSTPSPRPTAETRPNQSKKTQHGGQTLDLSPHDLKKYLSQPVRSIFHEQAKSIVAIQVRKSCLKKKDQFQGKKS